MIANLSYTSEILLNQAKVGLLLAALISAVVGSLILVIAAKKN
jgi:NhaA family Na+:H+ antiporter